MKKQMTNAEKKQNIKYKRAKAANNKKILAMNFDDFKKTFIEGMDEIEKMICETITWNGNQRSMVIKAFGEGIKKINEKLDIAEVNFKTLDTRLHDLEAFTAIMTIKMKEALQRKPMTLKERKAIANMVSIKWDESDDKTFNKAKAA